MVQHSPYFSYRLFMNHASSPAGIFISFEGIDGAGKSLHITALAQALEAQGRTVTLTREPGGTVLAEKIRTMVLHDGMDPLTEALLIFAGRRDHIVKVIAPALARGDVVLCDRFTDATFAYQGAGRGFDLQVLGALEQMVQSGMAAGAAVSGAMLEPDATVWFDLPAAVAAQRLVAARVPDRFESLPQAFFEAVAAGYAARAAGAPQRVVRVDADQAPEHVWQQIQTAFQNKGWL